MSIPPKKARSLWKERSDSTENDIQNGVMSIAERNVEKILGKDWEERLDNPQQLIMARSFPPGTPENTVYIDKKALAGIVHHTAPKTEEEWLALQITELLCNRMSGADRVIAFHERSPNADFTCSEFSMREYLGNDWRAALEEKDIPVKETAGSVQINFAKLYAIAEPLLQENMNRIIEFHRQTGN